MDSQGSLKIFRAVRKADEENDILDSSVKQERNNETWVLLNQATTNINTIENELLYPAGSRDQTIPSEGLIKVQKADPRIIDLKKKETVVNEEERKESLEVRRYLRQ